MTLRALDVKKSDLEIFLFGPLERSETDSALQRRNSAEKDSALQRRNPAGETRDSKNVPELILKALINYYVRGREGNPWELN